MHTEKILSNDNSQYLTEQSLDILGVPFAKFFRECLLQFVGQENHFHLAQLVKVKSFCVLHFLVLKKQSLSGYFCSSTARGYLLKRKFE
jgi:hypothetical protein